MKVEYRRNVSIENSRLVCCIFSTENIWEIVCAYIIIKPVINTETSVASTRECMTHPHLHCTWLPQLGSGSHSLCHEGRTWAPFTKDTALTASDQRKELMNTSLFLELLFLCWLPSRSYPRWNLHWVDSTSSSSLHEGSYFCFDLAVNELCVAPL